MVHISASRTTRTTEQSVRRPSRPTNRQTDNSTTNLNTLSNNIPNGSVRSLPHEKYKVIPKVSLSPDDFIQVNVCGTNYQLLRSTLARFPGTLLADDDKLKPYFVECMDAYYFDRQQECFDAILYFYQSGGNLIRPSTISMELFTEEAKFFEIAENVLKGLQEVEGFDAVGYEETVEEDVLPDNRYQRALWQLMEIPESSIPARILSLLTIIIIVVSVCSFCMETIPVYHELMYAGAAGHDDHEELESNTARADEVATMTEEEKADDDAAKKMVVEAIGYIELISITWFTIEYVLRFVSCPQKWPFIKSLMNFIDLLAIVPFYIIQMIDSDTGSPLAVVRVARLMRVLRVFKLSRHSKGLQVLGNSLKASLSELGMIVFLVCVLIIVFSSAIYYAEYSKNTVSNFESIPSTFWYALVTMTTVGYGDKVPATLLGKILGGLCAVTGVMTLALVVPVVASNFFFFYKRDNLSKAKEETDKILADTYANMKVNKSTSTSDISPDARLW